MCVCVCVRVSVCVCVCVRMYNQRFTYIVGGQPWDKIYHNIIMAGNFRGRKLS